MLPDGSLPIPISANHVSIVSLIYVEGLGSFFHTFGIPGADPDAFVETIVEMTGADPERVMPAGWLVICIYPTEGMVYWAMTHSHMLGSELIGNPMTVRMHANMGAAYAFKSKLRPLDNDQSPLYSIYEFMNLMGIKMGVDENGEQAMVPQESEGDRYMVDDLDTDTTVLWSEFENLLSENNNGGQNEEG